MADCVLLRALGADEGATLVESVCEGCIDVVVVIAEVSVYEEKELEKSSWQMFQSTSDFDARVVVAWDVIVAIAQHIVRFA